ncbi:hypothetical protein [Methylobacterium sp. GXF4]|uniref:hypothetical protein n=1 Tax=Methylobacterium sp. GXF4 TaxID=1096546 RepID=UPI000FFF0BAA|nr:hypothetical protein [Methylobacterium sp. GXF4]
MTPPNAIELFILKTPGWVLRLGLAVTMLIVLTTLPLMVAGPVMWILASRYIRLTEIVVEELREQCHARQRLEEYRGDHAVRLAEREARITALEVDLAQARLASTTLSETEEDRLYRRVGLHPQAPEFLVHAARRIYRIQLHPDRHRHHAPQAHQRYLRAEATFEDIARLRR